MELLKTPWTKLLYLATCCSLISGAPQYYSGFSGFSFPSQPIMSPSTPIWFSSSPWSNTLRNPYSSDRSLYSSLPLFTTPKPTPYVPPLPSWSNYWSSSYLSDRVSTTPKPIIPSLWSNTLRSSSLSERLSTTPEPKSPYPHSLNIGAKVGDPLKSGNPLDNWNVNGGIKVEVDPQLKAGLSGKYSKSRDAQDNVKVENWKVKGDLKYTSRNGQHEICVEAQCSQKKTTVPDLDMKPQVTQDNRLDLKYIWKIFTTTQKPKQIF